MSDTSGPIQKTADSDFVTLRMFPLHAKAAVFIAARSCKHIHLYTEDFTGVTGIKVHVVVKKSTINTQIHVYMYEI